MGNVVVDYLSLAYWSTLLTLCMGAVRTLQFLTPLSFAKKKVTSYLGKKGIKITCDWEEEVGKYDKNQYKVELVVHDDRFFKRCFHSTLGLGESYSDGYIDCDNIAVLFECFVKNTPVFLPRWLHNKVALARNRQGMRESHDVMDIHYNLGNDLYEYVLL